MNISANHKSNGRVKTRRVVLLKSALSYAKRGWSVLPLHNITDGKCSCGKAECNESNSSGKHPCTSHGLRDASSDLHQIRDWWGRYPLANIGIRTGKESGIDVLDVDPRHDGDVSLRKLEKVNGDLPDTLRARTGGGGQHLYFRHVPNLTKKVGIAAGLDMQANGAYIIAPPSNHKSGGYYTFEDPDVPLAEMPMWLQKLARGAGPAGKDSTATKTCKGQSAPEHVAVAPTRVGEPIREGKRNDTLTSMGGAMRRHGFSHAAITLALLEQNKAFDPPLVPAEVEKIAASVMRYRSAAESDLGSLTATERTPTAAQWPEQLKREAYHGLAGDLVKAIVPHTEADPAALLVQTLVAFGNVIGTGPHWKHGATQHCLNLFAGIVGSTGSGKGSGLDQVMELFRKVDSEWSSNPNIYAGLASGEGFIYMVRDQVMGSVPIKKNGRVTGTKEVIKDPGVSDKRLLLIQPEFAQVLEVLERSGNTLATKIRNAWDGKPLANSSLSHRLIATGAHVSIIVHTTQEDLGSLMRLLMIKNGFGNRFLWVCSRRSRSLPFGSSVPPEKRAVLVERLREAVEFAKGRGRMRFDKPAVSLWKSAYKTTLTRQSENPVTGRAMAQVRRMATILALLDRSERVREEHLKAALETWRYCVESANFIFGGVHRIDPVAEKALDALRQSRKKGLTRKEIHTNIFQGNKSAEEITRLLAGLQKQGQARVQTEPAGPKGGRPTERWFAV